MKRKIAKIALGGAIMLSTLAIPGYSSTLYSFSGIKSGGTVTVNGSNIVTGLSNVPFTTLVVGANLPDPVVSGNLNLSGSTLTLTGEIPAAGINSVVALVTIGLASPLVNTGGATILNVSAISASWVTMSSALLSALSPGNIAGPVTLSLAGSGSGGMFTVTSDKLTDLDAVPEPATLPLLAMGIGLGAIGLFVRGRSSKQAKR